MKQLFLIFILNYLAFACVQQKPAKNLSDQIYQYSVFTALANKVYDGPLTVDNLKEKGDIGLGTFNGLNGEMIVLDGTIYQLPADGTIRQPVGSDLVPFAVVTFFEPDKQLKTDTPTDYNTLKTFIENNLPSTNLGYTFRIEGDFSYLKCGSAESQKKPYEKTLSQALVGRPVFEKENISGTLVGFWFPEYMDNVNVPGFHLHFVSNDKNMAGHVLEFNAAKLDIAIDICSGFNIELPETVDFMKAEFDLREGYN